MILEKERKDKIIQLWEELGFDKEDLKIEYEYTSIGTKVEMVCKTTPRSNACVIDITDYSSW
jgi:hypothetical protein